MEIAFSSSTILSLTASSSGSASSTGNCPKSWNTIDCTKFSSKNSSETISSSAGLRRLPMPTLITEHYVLWPLWWLIPPTNVLHYRDVAKSNFYRQINDSNSFKCSLLLKLPTLPWSISLRWGYQNFISIYHLRQCYRTHGIKGVGDRRISTRQLCQHQAAVFGLSYLEAGTKLLRCSTAASFILFHVPDIYRQSIQIYDHEWDLCICRTVSASKRKDPWSSRISYFHDNEYHALSQTFCGMIVAATQFQ